MNVRRVYNRVYIKRIPNAAPMYRRVELNGPGGGGLPYERGGDARWKFGIKPLTERNLIVAQPFFDP